MPVVYSVGNFVFGTPGRFTEFLVHGIGLTVAIDVSADGPAQISVRCLVTDNAVVQFQPRQCTQAEAQANLPALSPQLAMQGDLGVLPCTCFVRRDGQ